MDQEVLSILDPQPPPTARPQPDRHTCVCCSTLSPCHQPRAKPAGPVDPASTEPAPRRSALADLGRAGSGTGSASQGLRFGVSSAWRSCACPMRGAERCMGAWLTLSSCGELAPPLCSSGAPRAALRGERAGALPQRAPCSGASLPSQKAARGSPRSRTVPERSCSRCMCAKCSRCSCELCCCRADTSRSVAETESWLRLRT